MKITDPHIIQTGEKKLIAAVQEHLDLKTLKNILMERMAETSFASRGGQIVVHDNQIAFRLDFDLQLSGSLLFDRQGNYIPDSSESRSEVNEKKFKEDSHRSSPPPETDLSDDEDEDDLDLLMEEEEREQRFPVQDEDSLDPSDEDDLDSDDILDDDIDDILKESRDFWEQKKGN
jgi:hypothetical protein